MQRLSLTLLTIFLSIAPLVAGDKMVAKEKSTKQKKAKNLTKKKSYKKPIIISLGALALIVGGVYVGGIVKDMNNMDGLIRQRKELYDNSKIEHALLIQKLNQQNSQLFKEVYNDDERINNDEYYNKLNRWKYKLDYLEAKKKDISELASNVDMLSPYNKKKDITSFHNDLVKIDIEYMKEDANSRKIRETMKDQPSGWDVIVWTFNFSKSQRRIVNLLNKKKKKMSIFFKKKENEDED